MSCSTNARYLGEVASVSHPKRRCSPLSCFHDELRTRVRTPLREQVWQFEVADTRIQCHINPPIETARGEVVRPVIADIQ